jgi:glyoxalase family protein
MTQPIAGIHHITALATDPKTNLAFYTEVLGLRLVKKTVNFDDPGTYHLYYGDETGRPGSILTFFPWPLARRGSRGAGQATVTAFSVPEGSLGWWAERLAAHGVVHERPERRFDEEVLTFLDPDGLKLELVAHAGAADLEPWRGAGIPEAFALRGFHSVALGEAALEPTAELLTEGLGLIRTAEAGDRYRFETRETADGTAAGTRVDVLHIPGVSFGRIAAGTVHHVAWRMADDEDQRAWRERLLGRGLHLTTVLDRQYFHSVYFREPGGVLFELATDPPGFAIDEPTAELGRELKLPPWLEPRRPEIEAALPDLEPAAQARVEFAARHARRWGGVVGLTGGLLGPPERRWEFSGSLAGTPVYLGTSDPDPHVPLERVQETAVVLRGLGGEVELEVFPGLGHTVSARELQAVRRRMARLDEAPGNGGDSAA